MGADYGMVKGWKRKPPAWISRISIEGRSGAAKWPGLTPRSRVSEPSPAVSGRHLRRRLLYGVMHHSPETPQCIREAAGLKPEAALRS